MSVVLTAVLAAEDVLGGSTTDVLGIGGAVAVVAAAVGWVWRIEKDLISRLRDRNKELESEREGVSDERDRFRDERDAWRFRYQLLSAKTGQSVPLPKLDHNGDEVVDPAPPTGGAVQ